MLHPALGDVLTSEMPEVPLPGGWLSQPVRVGDTVRRSTGPWTPAVHALLRHLEAVGYPYSPRVLGFDEKGREVLTYIEGEAATEPWPAALRREDGLRAFAAMLRDYHAAVASFVPPPDAVWRIGAVPLAVGEIVRHGDFGPWNTIWRQDQPVGVIDWDLAEPGPAILDVGYAALYGVPLHHQAGRLLDEGTSLRQRLEVFSAAAGAYTPWDVLRGVEQAQALERQRLDQLGTAGIEPWATFVARGERHWLAACEAWLAANRTSLL